VQSWRVSSAPYIVELEWLAYSYDNVGNVTALTDHWNSSESWTNVQYDHRDRLTQATRGGTTFTFSYNE
jgi:hypothetical protein